MFRAILTKIVNNCEGALSAVLMGFDGIPIDSHALQNSDFDMETITAELCGVMGQIRRAAEILHVGALDEVAIRSERLTYLIHVLTKEYFVGLALTPAGNFGKGRFLMRLAAHELRAEL